MNKIEKEIINEIRKFFKRKDISKDKAISKSVKQGTSGNIHYGDPNDDSGVELSKYALTAITQTTKVFEDYIKKNKDTIYRKYKLELQKLSKKGDDFEAGKEETTIDRVDLSEDKERKTNIQLLKQIVSIVYNNVFKLPKWKKTEKQVDPTTESYALFKIVFSDFVEKHKEEILKNISGEYNALNNKYDYIQADDSLTVNEKKEVYLLSVREALKTIEQIKKTIGDDNPDHLEKWNTTGKAIKNLESYLRDNEPTHQMSSNEGFNYIGYEGFDDELDVFKYPFVYTKNSEDYVTLTINEGLVRIFDIINLNSESNYDQQVHNLQLKLQQIQDSNIDPKTDNSGSTSQGKSSEEIKKIRNMAADATSLLFNIKNKINSVDENNLSNVIDFLDKPNNALIKYFYFYFLKNAKLKKDEEQVSKEASTLLAFQSSYAPAVSKINTMLSNEIKRMERTLQDTTKKINKQEILNRKEKYEAFRDLNVILLNLLGDQEDSIGKKLVKENNGRTKYEQFNEKLKELEKDYNFPNVFEKTGFDKLNLKSIANNEEYFKKFKSNIFVTLKLIAKDLDKERDKAKYGVTKEEIIDVLDNYKISNNQEDIVTKSKEAFDKAKTQESYLEYFEKILKNMKQYIIGGNKLEEVNLAKEIAQGKHHELIERSISAEDSKDTLEGKDPEFIQVLKRELGGLFEKQSIDKNFTIKIKNPKDGKDYIVFLSYEDDIFIIGDTNEHDNTPLGDDKQQAINEFVNYLKNGYLNSGPVKFYLRGSEGEAYQDDEGKRKEYYFYTFFDKIEDGYDNPEFSSPYSFFAAIAEDTSRYLNFQVRVVEQNEDPDQPFVYINFKRKWEELSNALRDDINDMYKFDEKVKEEAKKESPSGKRDDDNYLQENLNIILETLINNYINKRKQQWQKRTM